MQAIEILVERLASEAVWSAEDCGKRVDGISKEASENGLSEPAGGGQLLGFTDTDQPDPYRTAASQSAGKAESTQSSAGAQHEEGSHDFSGSCSSTSDLQSVTINLGRLQCGPEGAQEVAHTNAETFPNECPSSIGPSHTQEGIEHHEDDPQARLPNAKKKRLQVAVGKKPARNRECPCGSKKRYKNCCGPAEAAASRRLATGIVEEPAGPSIPAIYV